MKQFPSIFLTFFLLSLGIPYNSGSQVPAGIFDSPSAFLTAAIKTLFGSNHEVVFIGTSATGMAGTQPPVLTGDLHGEFTFSIDKASPEWTKVSALVRVTNYLVYNQDGHFGNIYAPVDPAKTGYGSISSANPWKVRSKFQQLVPQMEKYLHKTSPAELYKKYLSIFLPLKVELHTNVLLPAVGGVHGQLSNKDELFVKSDADIFNFPFSNAGFIGSGAELVDADTGAISLTIIPGWKALVSVVKTPSPPKTLTKEIVERHINEYIMRM